MSVVSVNARSFILALFIRDDGERFLLGDNGYDFKSSQLHFSANVMENDEVAKQGTDGTLLAGQVRRASVQSFDGYVGDATMPKEQIEQLRRAFFAFFAKGHHFRVIYVDCDRNAWQRKGGYIVDAPEVKELWQIHPEYHVGLNFEDVNYYTYDENSDGEEISANSQSVPVSSDVEGGLVWDEDGAVSDHSTIEYDTETETEEGKALNIEGAVGATRFADIQLKGDTSQAGTPTPSAPVPVKTVAGENVVKVCGKNLLQLTAATSNTRGITTTVDTANGEMTFSGTTTAGYPWLIESQVSIEAGTYTVSIDQTLSYLLAIRFYYDSSNYTTVNISAGSKTATATLANDTIRVVFMYNIASSGVSVSATTIKPMIEAGSTATDFEPYIGQDYEVNLGKNLLDISTFAIGSLVYGQPRPDILYRINCGNNPIPALPNTTYTISCVLGDTVKGVRVGVHQLTASKTFISDSGWQQIGTNKYTFTTGATTGYMALIFSLSTTSSTVDTSTENTTAYNDAQEWLRGMVVQCELGSTATTYAPYFTPIELCKIGDYQDYIYKDGNEWKIHKEVGSKALTSANVNMFQLDTSTNYSQLYISKSTIGLPNGWSAGVAVCSHFKENNTAAVGVFRTNANGNNAFFYLPTSVTDLNGAKTYMDGLNGSYIYYVLANSTDTTITNAVLIDQLEALANGYMYSPQSNISSTFAVGNEQAILNVEYFTKYGYILTAGGYEWEEGGSGGPTTLLNDSISNVYPIWTVYGPTLNPTLENTTTGEMIEYVGLVAEGQTLVIDMGEQTAMLDGLNVLSDVVGEFVSLAPGANTIIYSTGLGDGASKIGWSEIVG